MYNFDVEIDRRNTGSLKWDVGCDELPMWIADMDFQTAPEIKNAIIKRAEHGIYAYSVIPDSWYSSIINWWKRRHGFTIEKEWMQFTTGVIPAISSIVQRVTNIGDNVVVMTPVFDIFFHSIENFGRHTVECKLSYDNYTYSLDFEKLETLLSDPLTTMMILCNPHNPIGKIWSKEELKKIGSLCAKYGVTIISDEIHCDLTNPGKEYIPFASVSPECADISITCLAASKTFNLAGLQSAAVVVPNPFLRNTVVRGLNSNEVAEPNCFAVTATVAAFTQGERWLNELNEYIYENRMCVKEFLSSLPEVHLTDNDACYVLWINISEVADSSEKFCDFLRKTTGLYLSEGSQFRGNGNNFVRMNIACPRKRLLDGLQRFAKGVKTFKNK